VKPLLFDAIINLLLPPIRDRDRHHKTLGELAAVLRQTGGAHVLATSPAGIDLVFRYASGLRVRLFIGDTLTGGRAQYVAGRHPKPLACYLWVLLRNADNLRFETRLDVLTCFNDRPFSRADGSIDWPYIAEVYRTLWSTPAAPLLRALPPAVTPQMGDRRQQCLALDLAQV